MAPSYNQPSLNFAPHFDPVEIRGEDLNAEGFDWTVILANLHEDLMADKIQADEGAIAQDAALAQCSQFG
jgi:hypothetical protein